MGRLLEVIVAGVARIALRGLGVVASRVVKARSGWTSLFSHPFRKGREMDGAPHCLLEF